MDTHTSVAFDILNPNILKNVFLSLSLGNPEVHEKAVVLKFQTKGTVHIPRSYTSLPVHIMK